MIDNKSAPKINENKRKNKDAPKDKNDSKNQNNSDNPESLRHSQNTGEQTKTSSVPNLKKTLKNIEHAESIHKNQDFKKNKNEKSNENKNTIIISPLSKKKIKETPLSPQIRKLHQILNDIRKNIEETKENEYLSINQKVKQIEKLKKAEKKILHKIERIKYFEQKLIQEVQSKKKSDTSKEDIKKYEQTFRNILIAADKKVGIAIAENKYLRRTFETDNIYNLDLSKNLLDEWLKNFKDFEKLKQINSDLYEHDSITECNEKLNSEFLFNGKKMIKYRFFGDKNIKERYYRFEKGRILKPNRKKNESNYFEIDSYCKELKVGTQHDGRVYHYLICPPYINDEQELEDTLSSDRKKSAIAIKKGLFIVRIPSELKSEDAMKLFLHGPKDIEGVSPQYIKVKDYDLVPVSDEEYGLMNNELKNKILSGYKLDKEPKYFHLCGILDENNINSDWFKESPLNKFVKDNVESWRIEDFSIFKKLEESNKILISKIDFESKELDRLKQITSKIVETTKNNEIKPYIDIAEKELADITGTNNNTNNINIIRRCIEIDNRELNLSVVFTQAEDSYIRAKYIIYPKSNEIFVRNIFNEEVFDNLNEAYEYKYNNFYNSLKKSKSNYFKVSSNETVEILGTKSGIQSIELISRYNKISKGDIIVKTVLDESAGGLQPILICFTKEKYELIKKEFNSRLFDSSEEAYDLLYHDLCVELENNLYLTAYRKIGKNNFTLYHSTIKSLKKRSKGDIITKFVWLKSNESMQFTKIVFLKNNLNEVKKEFDNRIYDSKSQYEDIITSDFYKALEENPYLKSTEESTCKIFRIKYNNGYAIERFKGFAELSKGEIVVKLVEMDTNNGRKAVTICFLKKKTTEIKNVFNNELFDSLEEFLEWKFNLFKKELEKCDKKYFTPFCNEAKNATRLQDSSYINKLFREYSKKSKKEIDFLSHSSDKTEISKTSKDLIITRYSYVYSGQITTLNNICLFNKDLNEIKEKLNGNVFETKEEAKIFKKNNPNIIQELKPSNNRLFIKTPPTRQIKLNYSERKKFKINSFIVPEEFIGAKIFIENHETDDNLFVIKLFEDFSEYKKNHIIDTKEKNFQNSNNLDSSNISNFIIVPKSRRINLKYDRKKKINQKSLIIPKEFIGAKVYIQNHEKDDNYFVIKLFEDFSKFKKDHIVYESVCEPVCESVSQKKRIFMIVPKSRRVSLKHAEREKFKVNSITISKEFIGAKIYIEKNEKHDAYYNIKLFEDFSKYKKGHIIATNEKKEQKGTDVNSKRNNRYIIVPKRNQITLNSEYRKKLNTKSLTLPKEFIGAKIYLEIDKKDNKYFSIKLFEDFSIYKKDYTIEKRKIEENKFSRNVRDYLFVPKYTTINLNSAEKEKFNKKSIKVPEEFIGAKIYIEKDEDDNKYLLIKLFEDFSKYKKDYIIGKREIEENLYSRNIRSYLNVHDYRQVILNSTEREKFKINSFRVPKEFIGAKIYIENYEKDDNYIVIKLFEDFSKYEKDYVINIQKKTENLPRLLAVIPEDCQLKIGKYEQKFLNTTYQNPKFDVYWKGARVLFNKNGTFTLFSDFKTGKKGEIIKKLNR